MIIVLWVSCIALEDCLDIFESVSLKYELGVNIDVKIFIEFHTPVSQ